VNHLTEAFPYLQIVLAVGGWIVFYVLFRSSGLLSRRIKFWFVVMAAGATIAVLGAAARIVSDDNSVEDWGGAASIVGLAVEVAPVLIGSTVGSKRRR
jgi:hypothetical protein